MTTNTPLKVGSSLLWSIIATAPLSDSAAVAIPADAFIRIREQATEMLVGQRSASHQAVIDRTHRIFEGLKAMFELGDRRVMPSASFFSDETPDERTIRDVVVNHRDLHDEALAAAPQAPRMVREHPSLFNSGRRYEAITVGKPAWAW